MKTIAFVFLLSAIDATDLWAQGTFEPVRWMIRPGVQVNIPIRHHNEITDRLISLNDASVYVAAVDIARFWGHWGIEIQSSVGASNSRQAAPFAKDVANKYPDYYVTSQRLNTDNSVGFGLVGLNYKIEQARFAFIGRFLIGANGYMASDGSASLKQRNSNARQTITWTTANYDLSGFMMTGGVLAMYRINKRFGVTVDTNYNMSHCSLTYTETFINQGTGVSSRRNIDYGNFIKQLSVGVGLAVVW